jgi:hypothetical protein
VWRVDPRPARSSAAGSAALQAAREAVASVSRPRVCVVFSTLKPAFLRFLLARSLRLAKPTWRRGRSIADHPASEGHRSKSRCRCGHQVGARLQRASRCPAMDSILKLHHQEFPPVQGRVLPPPAPITRRSCIIAQLLLEPVRLDRIQDAERVRGRSGRHPRHSRRPTLWDCSRLAALRRRPPGADQPSPVTWRWGRNRPVPRLRTLSALPQARMGASAFGRSPALVDPSSPPRMPNRAPRTRGRWTPDINATLADARTGSNLRRSATSQPDARAPLAATGSPPDTRRRHTGSACAVPVGTA